MKPRSLFPLMLVVAGMASACASNSEPAVNASADAALTCTDAVCDPEKCGWVPVDGSITCIEKPDCAGLSESACAGTQGCTVIHGRLATDPTSTSSVAGCGDGTNTAGTATTCTALGATGPCWVLPSDRAPSGWEKWSCAGPTTESECLGGGPYGS